jgi:hypothetical protein
LEVVRGGSPAEGYDVLEVSALRALLSDPECPYGRNANDIPSALRENRSPTKTRWIDQRALLDFIVKRTGEKPSVEHVDNLMLHAIGARHARVLDLDRLLRRTVRRLAGRPERPSVTYEVPEPP